jgi:branched-chain amino acid transport system ATP-binding protein
VLDVRNVEVVYSDVILVLRGVSLCVPPGAIVALLGANGAGKTTLKRALTGLLPIHRGELTKGSIRLDGEPIHHLGAPAIVRRGVAQVMEGRRVFDELTVEDNLVAGAFTVRERVRRREVRDELLARFPVLGERRRSLAGFLSGGEQQMLALARALMSAPTLLLLDEPSLGLAPLLVRQISAMVAEINRRGTAVLIVEQNAEMALSLASYGYVLENGKVVKEGTSAALRGDRDIQEFYLGAGDAGRASFRDVKTYRRKKRWSA